MLNLHLVNLLYLAAAVLFILACRCWVTHAPRCAATSWASSAWRSPLPRPS